MFKFYANDDRKLKEEREKASKHQLLLIFMNFTRITNLILSCAVTRSFILDRYFFIRFELMFKFNDKLFQSLKIDFPFPHHFNFPCRRNSHSR